MIHENGSGSSENLNSQFDVTSSIKEDEDPLDHDKMVGYASSSSFSPPSSRSSSYRLEVNGGENDVTIPDFEENESVSRRSNPESPSSTPKTSSSQESGRTTLSLSRIASPRFSDMDSLNLSPKQSPPIQVMAQSDDYDPNRIPSAIFAPKQSIDSEWSVASDESLFSIQMGHNSFCMDDYFISQSGKVHWLEDGFEFSCFTPDANESSNLTSPSSRMSIVTDSTVEDERRSNGEKEELLETLNSSPIDTRREKEESSPAWEGRPNSRVPNGTVASPTEGRNSDSSSQSTGSFAFPVLAGGSPVKEDAEKAQSPPSTPKAAETTPEAPSTTPKAGGNQWFNCFSCFPVCC